MSENVYEGFYILDSNLYAKNPEEVSGIVSATIEKVGGEVLLSRYWDERKLAYTIKGHKRGTYWLTYFKLDPLKIKELTRLFQINENIIRFLFLKVDPRLVEMLVEHANAGHLHAGERAAETVASVETSADVFDEEEEMPEDLVTGKF